MKWWPLVLACACATPGRVEPPPQQTPVVTPQTDEQGAVTAQFRDAVSARRFDEVLALLSKRWRERYDVKTLARDFDAEPLASLRSGMPLKLVQEDGAWRVDSLE